MAAAPGDNDYVLYCRTLPAELPPFAGRMQVRVMPLARLWTHIRLAWELWRQPPEVLFVPSHVLPWNVRLVRGMRVVTTVHDLGFLHFPQAHTRFQNMYLRLTTRWAAWAADTVIAISQATADDLVRYTGIDRRRVVVIPHGVAPVFTPLAKKPMPWVRYMVYVGTLQPRKNLARLIEAFARAQTHPDTQLVIAGRAGWLSEPLAEIARAHGVADRVHLIGFVPDADLPSLLAGARAFVVPSLYEGFGMPVLEAMATTRGDALPCFDARSAAGGVCPVPPADGAAVVLAPDACARGSRRCAARPIARTLLTISACIAASVLDPDRAAGFVI